MFSDLVYNLSSRCRYYFKPKKLKNDQELGLHELRCVQFFSFNAKGDASRKNDCQDSFTIMDNNPDAYIFVGVFDGHGIFGKEASNATCDNFQQYIEKNLRFIRNFSSNIDR